jgi:hypothetical protein
VLTHQGQQDQPRPKSRPKIKCMFGPATGRTQRQHIDNQETYLLPNGTPPRQEGAIHSAANGIAGNYGECPPIPTPVQDPDVIGLDNRYGSRRPPEGPNNLAPQLGNELGPRSFQCKL